MQSQRIEPSVSQQGNEAICAQKDGWSKPSHTTQLGKNNKRTQNAYYDLEQSYDWSPFCISFSIWLQTKNSHFFARLRSQKCLIASISDTFLPRALSCIAESYSFFSDAGISHRMRGLQVAHNSLFFSTFKLCTFKQFPTEARLHYHHILSSAEKSSLH